MPGEALNESSRFILEVGTERKIQKYALAADLVVATLAEKGRDEGNLELEVALIDAGRPVIALPRSWAPVGDDAPIVMRGTPARKPPMRFRQRFLCSTTRIEFTCCMLAVKTMFPHWTA